MRQHKYEYDAFISHAVEDKIPIANELCAKLERAGLRIWYSGKELGIGDSIEKTIASGLNRSRYGIVIFSPTYLSKNWTIREFYTLLAKEIEEQKVILPVLYNITLDELKNKDLVMADRFAADAERGIDHVVDRLVAEIKRPARPAKRKEAWFSKMWLILAISLLANAALLIKGHLFTHTADPYAAPVQKAQPVRQAGDPTTLLGEIQGLLAAVSACPHEQRHGLRTTYPSTFDDNDGDIWLVETGRHAAGLTSDGSTPGQKVTMAIVFQIETPDAARLPVERKNEGIFQTASLEKDEARLISLKPQSDAGCGCAGCAGVPGGY